MRIAIRFAFCAVAVLVCSVLAHAQPGRGGAEWVVDGADAQRSHWIPADTKISPESFVCHSMRFKSLSTAKSRLPLPATNANERNPR